MVGTQIAAAARARRTRPSCVLLWNVAFSSFLRVAFSGVSSCTQRTFHCFCDLDTGGSTMPNLFHVAHPSGRCTSARLAPAQPPWAGSLKETPIRRSADDLEYS